MKVAEDVVWCPVEGELVLFDSSKGLYFGLNEVGSSVWRLIADGSEETEIIKALQATYEVDTDTASREVQRIIAELIRSGLLIAA
jgi:hypothetical protein